MPPQPPQKKYNEFFGAYGNGEILAETREQEKNLALGPQVDLGPTGHAYNTLPYADRPRMPAPDVVAERAADVVDTTLPPASPELSARRVKRLGASIIEAREKAHTQERRTKVMKRAGELMLLHTSWPGVLKYENPYRPTTPSERYSVRRMDTWLRKSRDAANKTNHYRRTDNGRPVALRESSKNYAAGGPATPPPPTRLSRSERGYKAHLKKHASGTFIQRRKLLGISPTVKADLFDRMADSGDLLGRIAEVRAEDARNKEQRLTRLYTGAEKTRPRRALAAAKRKFTR